MRCGVRCLLTSGMPMEAGGVVYEEESSILSCLFYFYSIILFF